LRHLRRYLRQHPDRRQLVRGTLAVLAADPHAPSLRLHPLRGQLRGLYAVRLSYGDRILLTFLISRRQIILLTVGTHDEGYR
jgi:mRNA-degrading endonuclease YafQ of YafQ-DinJ toxin-antitoxin module